MISLEILREWLLPIIVFSVFVIIGQLFKMSLEAYIKKYSEGGESRLGNKVVKTLRIPILLIFSLSGLEMALRYVTIPYKVAKWVHPTIYFGMGILTIGAISQVLSKLITHYGEKYPGLQSLSSLLRKIVVIVVWVIGIMVILSWLGISIYPLLVSFGVGGIAIALALQGTLQDFFAGINIMTDRSIKQGDYIKLQSGEEGYVQDIGWRTTKVRMLPNNMAIIPNSKLSATLITNYYSPEQEMSTLVDVGVSYDSDLRKVEEVTVDVAKKTLQEVQGGVEDFEPFIRYHTFDDFSINFTVILRVKEYVDKYLVTTEFIKALQERYKEEGIVIPFPIRSLEWRKDREKPQKPPSE